MAEDFPAACSCDILGGAVHRHMPSGPVLIEEVPEPVEVTKSDAGDILSMNAHDVIDTVNELDDVDAIEVLLKAERAGKDRVTVVEAMKARIKGLKAEE